MYHTSIDYLDRLRAKNVFQGTYASLLGAFGSLILIAAVLAFYVPTIASFFKGQMYSQSEFSLQQTPFGNITIPKDMRVAMVFYNKTDNKIANHTLLRQYLTVTTYQQTNSRSTLKSDTILPGCDPAYFQNTQNPPQSFTDCVIFAKNSKVDITYYPSRGYVYFGFFSFPFCQDPFACLTNSTFRNSLNTNFTNVFNNFSYTLYFTSRVLQADGTFKDQVFSIFSSSFNTPFTITSDIYGEIQIRNTTMDDSLLPWFNYKQKTYPAWYGTMLSTNINSAFLVSTGVRNGFVTSRFQNQVIRHYKKIDWLLGIIGGAMFLFFIVLYLPLYYVNQLLKQGKLIEQFFVRHTLNVTDENLVSDQKKLVFFAGNVHISRVEQSRLYIFKKLLPCYETRQERELKMVFDITRLIKNIKVAERNLKNQKIPLNEQPKKLKIALKNQEEQKKRDKAQLLADTSQIGQQLGVQPQFEQSFIKNDIPQPVFQTNQVPLQTQLQRQQEQNEIRATEWRAKQQFTQQRLAQTNDWDSQTINRYSNVIGMHPKVTNAFINSDNASQLAYANPTLMALTNKQEAYQQALQPYRYSQLAKRRVSFFSNLSNHFFQFVRFFDIFGVQPQFGLHSQGSSIFGCLCSILIAGCSILFFIFIILNSMNYQTYVEYEFEEADKIKYNLVTGVGFRPFLCLSFSSSYMAINSTNPTIQLTFFSVSNNQTTTIPMINLDQSMYSYLGIAEDSSYRSINLKYCWTMQDNITIPMGGYNTSNQAYFGFRFDSYCLGTVAYCQSINSTLRTRFINFMGLTSNTITLYLPFSTYDPQSKALTGGGIQPQIIRQGVSGISINSGTVQNLYVSSIQLIDDYTMRFMNTEKPPVIQQKITTDRYQLGSDINGVNVTLPFYEVRVRPNGQLIKVVQTGIPTDVVLGVIGGICVIFYAIFHWFAKSLNHFNVRCFLALKLYGEQIIQQSFFYKLLVFLLPECFCKCLGKQLSQSLLIDKEIDRVIKSQLNHSELIKQNYAVYQLSTVGFTKIVQKLLGLVFFKEPVSEDYLSQAPQHTLQNASANGDQFIGVQEHEHQSESQGQMHIHQHGVANLQQAQGQNQPVQNINEEMIVEAPNNLEEVQPYNPYRPVPQGNKVLEAIDWFSSKPSFTLNGERKVKSVFGSCVFFGMVACIIVLVLYEIQAYISGSNSRISYQKYMISDISNEPELVLNSSNFRLALGFYINPNATLLNVSSLVNTTSNVIITVNQISMVRNSNNLLTQNETVYRLVPCTNDYFDNFKDKNTDYSFLNGLPFAWCLPLNISLNLTAISLKNPMQYFTMRIINRTNDNTTLTNLRTLTSTYAVALYMTFPQIDLASKGFKYMVKPIRGVPRPIFHSTQYNVTLYKQEIVYKTPKYTLNQPQNKVSSYIYLNNKNSERNYTVSNSSLPRSHNITFSYMGLVEKYVYQQPNPNEIVGVIGGIIALFYLVSLLIAESFNMYKFKYLVGKQLYLIRRSQAPSQSREKKKDQVVDYKLQLIERERDMDYQVEVNELQLFIFWIQSFFCYCRCFKKFSKVCILQQKAEQALNLSEFLAKTAKLKDTLNKKYFLQTDPNIKVTNLFARLPLLEEQRQFQLQQVRKQYIQKHGLSYFDQYILSLAQKHQESFENVYADSSIYNKIYQNLEGQAYNFVQMKIEKQSLQVQVAVPELRPQTTKFEDMPKESFDDLRVSEGDGIQDGIQELKKEKEEKVLQPQSLPMLKKETSQGVFVMIDDQIKQKEQMQLKGERSNKQKSNQLEKYFQMMEEKDPSEK